MAVLDPDARLKMPVTVVRLSALSVERLRVDSEKSPLAADDCLDKKDCAIDRSSIRLSLNGRVAV